MRVLKNGNTSRAIYSLSVLSAIIISLMPIKSTVSAEQIETKTETPLISREQVAESLGKVPVYFEENQGQFHKKAKYFARGTKGYSLFLTATDAVYVVQSSKPKIEELINPTSEIRSPKSATAVYMSLVNGNNTAQAEGFSQLEHRTNYFRGTKENWRTDIPNYQAVRFDNVYSGIDLVWQGQESGGVQYDFVVAPNAIPEQIEWEIKGAKAVELTAEGDLIIKTEDGEIRQQKPFTYQQSDGLKSEIESGFRLTETNGNVYRITFELGDYDRGKELVIDPTVNIKNLAFSTFLGGSDIDSGNSIAIDAFGNSYVTGYTDSTNFPTSPGAFDTTMNSPAGFVYDCFVTKLNATGSRLVYSTYLGGNAGDSGSGIAVDNAGNAFVFGNTSSTNFPTTTGAFDTILNDSGGDAFVTKLNANGSALIYSTYLGGTSPDPARDITVDNAGNAFLIGWTLSADFPRTPGAFDTTSNGNADAFVTKLNSSGSALVYSTFLGGSGNEEGNSIAIDSAGNAYVSGKTESSNFPTTTGAFDRTNNGSADAFVAKLNTTGTSLTYSTFLGESGFDTALGITVNSAGNVFVTGFTSSTAFPTTTGAFDTSFSGGTDAFITKFNPTGSALIYSTFLGVGGTDVGFDIAIDNAGNAFVTGYTSSVNFPTTVGAFDTSHNGNDDGFVVKINASGSALIYSTLIGGSQEDWSQGIAIDRLGRAFITGFSDSTGSSTGFPTTPGAFDTSQNEKDVFVARFGTSSMFDFDGDGKTDISIFRPSNGQWWYQRSSDSGVRAYFFGNSADKLVPGDYTGDGKTDIAVRRPSQVSWLVLRSEDDSFFSFPFGLVGDVAVTGDYDGDGKDDAVVFRPSNGTWFISNSSGGTSAVQFGNSTDKPVPADYDGDGKTDIAIFRPSNGQWWILRSSDGGNRTFTFGVSTDRPVPGDYTGDGKDDVAFWRPSTGEWFILRSEDLSFFSFPFGTSGDIPSAGDYDGDGKFDSAVFRPSSATWFVNRSTGGTLIAGFGVGSDIPIPSVFVP